VTIYFQDIAAGISSERVRTRSRSSGWVQPKTPYTDAVKHQFANA
jgi:hypothetical protein